MSDVVWAARAAVLRHAVTVLCPGVGCWLVVERSWLGHREGFSGDGGDKHILKQKHITADLTPDSDSPSRVSVRAVRGGAVQWRVDR